MATDLTANALVRLRTTYLNILDMTNTRDALDESWADTLTNGAGTDEADVIWHDRRTATAAADDIDLHTSLSDVYGNAATFATIKCIAIHNRSTMTTENLAIGADAGAPFGNWVANAATDILNVGPDGILFIWSPRDPYPVVDTTADVLQIDPGADTIEYDIMIIGTSVNVASASQSVSQSASQFKSGSQSLSQSLSLSASQSLSQSMSKSGSLAHTGSLSKSRSQSASQSASIAQIGSLSKSRSLSRSQSASHYRSASQSRSQSMSQSASIAQIGSLSKSRSQSRSQEA